MKNNFLLYVLVTVSLIFYFFVVHVVSNLLVRGLSCSTIVGTSAISLLDAVVQPVQFFCGVSRAE